MSDLAADLVGPEPGGFEWPCESNDDCLSGYCVAGPGGGVCTVTCIDECPEGWKCTQDTAASPDLVFVCMQVHQSLCSPCLGDEDCYFGGLDSGARCVEFGAEGAFCGATCSVGSDCPADYDCDEALLLTGASSLQCVRQDGQTCECSEFAVFHGAWTDCYVENQAGSCPGTRQCTEEGVPPCDALEPTVEECNGLDDDCDGEVDQDLGATTCGEGVCNHEVPNCAGGAPQECDPFEGVVEEWCNGEDDDCDGDLDGDTPSTTPPSPV